MIRILIGTLFLISILSQIPPPTWPQSFHQSFVQTYDNSTFHSVGRFYYDTKRSVARLDRNFGTNQEFCHSVLPDANGPCNHLFRDSKFYIYHTQHRQCCFCCDYAHGCKPHDRDWLKDAKYLGQQTLSGQKFYKWGTKVLADTVDYYATQTDDRIPRRETYQGKRHLDYIMNTYSTDPIPDEVFALPSYCGNITCPATTICGKFRSQGVVYQ